MAGGDGDHQKGLWERRKEKLQFLSPPNISELNVHLI